MMLNGAAGRIPSSSNVRALESSMSTGDPSLLCNIQDAVSVHVNSKVSGEGRPTSSPISQLSSNVLICKNKYTETPRHRRRDIPADDAVDAQQASLGFGRIRCPAAKFAR